MGTLRLLVDPLAEEWFIESMECGGEADFNKVYISMEDLREILNNEASPLGAIEGEHDQLTILAAAVSKAKFKDQMEPKAESDISMPNREEKRMQYVPDDTVVLTTDEAQAMLNALLGDEFKGEDYDSAVQTLREQLEYEEDKTEDEECACSSNKCE